jgi:hypothetical protein
MHSAHANLTTINVQLRFYSALLYTRVHAHRISTRGYATMFDRIWGHFTARVAECKAAHAAASSSSSATSSSSAAVARKPKFLRLSKIPFWSEQQCQNIIGEHLSDKEFAKAFRRALLKWHPDKFESLYGAVIDPRDRARAKRRLHKLAQYINRLKQDRRAKR